jgi:hypothetical protein
LKKRYVVCPYCQDEKSISGMTMHVKNKYGDKFEDFKSKFAELKKTAVIKESTSRQPVKPGDEPQRIEDKQGDKSEDKHPARGDDKPTQGKSFLREFDEWADSNKF